MINFMAYTLREDPGPTEDFFYMPLLGFTLMFIVNQVLIEYTQLKRARKKIQYFADPWNWNDLAYLGLCITVVTSHTFNLFSLHFQRVIAAIASVFLWFKVLDWLRLFN